MNVLFLGYGRMGAAIGDAWVKAGLVGRIVAVDPSAPARDGVQLYADVSEVQEHAFDLIILAVKPALAVCVLEQLSDSHLGQATLVSVAAGVTCATLAKAVSNRCPVIRTMPNTPIMAGAGCTVLFSLDSMSPKVRASVSQLFEAVGKAFWVAEEGMLDAVTAISGSGPAYYHLFSEAMADAAITLGLPAELGRALAAQTAYGASVLQNAPNAEFASLRLAVTSPNGTTAAAISVFENRHSLRTLVSDAVQAAYDRSRELSRG
jgi:pyrroline-5-carboxylate reductase